jgi:hypothetical protein
LVNKILCGSGFDMHFLQPSNKGFIAPLEVSWVLLRKKLNVGTGSSTHVLFIRRQDLEVMGHNDLGKFGNGFTIDQ